MLFQPEEVPEDTVGRMDQVLGYKQLHTSLEPLQAQMQENALLAKQIALCVQDKQRLQQELAAAKHALDTARRELERQRSSDAGVFAAKVKAEEALRIAVRGEDEARRQLAEARREIARLTGKLDKYDEDAQAARTEALRAEGKAASESLAYVSQVAVLQGEKAALREQVEEMTREILDWRNKALALDTQLARNSEHAAALQGCLSRVERRVNDFGLESSLILTELAQRVHEEMGEAGVGGAEARLAQATDALLDVTCTQLWEASGEALKAERQRHATTAAELSETKDRLRQMRQRLKAVEDAHAQAMERGDALADHLAAHQSESAQALREESEAHKEAAHMAQTLVTSQRSLQSALAEAQEDRQQLMQRVVTLTDKTRSLSKQAGRDQARLLHLQRQVQDGERCLEQLGDETARACGSAENSLRLVAWRMQEEQAAALLRQQRLRVHAWSQTDTGWEAARDTWQVSQGMLEANSVLDKRLKQEQQARRREAAAAQALMDSARAREASLEESLARTQEELAASVKLMSSLSRELGRRKQHQAAGDRGVAARGGPGSVLAVQERDSDTVSSVFF